LRAYSKPCVPHRAFHLSGSHSYRKLYLPGLGHHTATAASSRTASTIKGLSASSHADI
jgi:hypothetical protein